LNPAVGTAEHYGPSFLALDFAKAALPKRIAANEAFLWDGAAKLRRTGFVVSG
jgi:hypothetical protein